VSKLDAQDIGGTLTLLINIPQEAEQLVIRRVTSKTQETDLYNGARLTAELIEKMSDKLTLCMQEISEQVISKDDQQIFMQEVYSALKAVEESVKLEVTQNNLKHEKDFQSLRQEMNQANLKFAKESQSLLAQVKELNYAVEDLIKYIEDTHGLGEGIPLMVEEGFYLVTEEDDYIVVN
jgi:hypothetical protein